jgi:hypothetical protein
MNMRLSLFTTLCFFTTCVVFQLSQAGTRPVPVMIGGEPDLDACGAVGVVSGLDSKPASTLSVRSGPGSQFEAIDRLSSGTRIWLCEHQGRWVGIVYGPDGQDCGIATSSQRRRPYTGPCTAGWVFDKYVTLVAG